ncbi:MAG TPA: DUF2157 domain-containing protein [Chitinophaga sp.]|uniref:DUF2157 domain-containing protein n=1 Tax=Chitinophaga sp. TaxID=1869181 RepID=UPI002D1981D8|nr:DUF2157 domain-containing protein [Chitinophaga sp.]HVI48845.1 DUF2157 domain-containing protein [Chitinophaga sp.]
MDTQLFEKLHREGLINSDSLTKISHAGTTRLFSLHWEIKTLLYLGVLLLSGGLGILVYENIDTIGHQAILAFLALICAGSFWYCIKQHAPFSRNKVTQPNTFFDYILLLGCLTFVTFIGYLQYQYSAFGTAYGLAVFVPLVVLFFSAYYFDHIGVLSMAITNLAAWLGVTITPFQLLNSGNFSSNQLIYTGMLLGLALLAAGLLSVKQHFKTHFAFTYENFGAHLFFVACIAAMCSNGEASVLWFLLMLGIGYLIYKKAIGEQSFYFLLITVLYLYVGFTIFLFRLISNTDWVVSFFLYLVVSAPVVAVLLVNLNKKIKHDRLQ